MPDNKPTPQYNFKNQEKKWRKKWEEEKLYQPNMDKAKKPFHNLMMFPYPSAEGLHIGGIYTFTGVDTFGRFKKMQGFEVFEPIGLDGFGIHSENYAMKIGEHIEQVSKRTEKNFYRQLSSIGNMYDWSRTVETYKPEYYKWTQWIFLQLFKKGLAYQKKAKVNWCPWCKTVLSDEQVIQGQCERCDSQVEKKELKQWFFKITDYADRLLKNLEWIDWSEDVKTNQRNWIGKSEGATVKFSISNNQHSTNKEDVLILHGWENSSKSAWIPSTKKHLEKLGHKVFAYDAPNTDEPVFDEWFDFIQKKIKKNNLKNFTVIGHSMGGLLACKLAEKHQLKKLILVAPVGPQGSKKYLKQFADKISKEDMEIFQKFQDRKIDIKKIKSNSSQIQFIFGEKDPWITQEIVDYYEANFSEHKSQVLKGQKHFEESEGVIKLEELEAIFNSQNIEVFTTRPDTLFGATYMVLAPEHELIEKSKSQIENWNEVEKYITKAKNKSEQERKEDEKDLPAPRPNLYFIYVLLCDDGSFYIGQTQDLKKRWEEHFSGKGARHTKIHKPKEIIHYEKFQTREEAVKREKDLKTGFGRKWLKREFKAGRTRQAGKTGVEIKGIKAINPVNNEEIPIWVADYVLSGYGTGAIMAVPAHDERDWEFAKKYNIEIKEVVTPMYGTGEREDEVHRDTISAVIKRESDGKFLFLKIKDDFDKGDFTPVIGGIKEGESVEDAVKREVKEETGFSVKSIKELGGKIESHFYAGHKKVWRKRLDQPVLAYLESEQGEEISPEEAKKHEIVWLSEKEALKKISFPDVITGFLRVIGKNKAYTEPGRAINSDFLDGLKTIDAKEKMIKWLEEKGFGERSTDYKLRDWCVSRQRYWGPPIPIIYCEKCGVIPVPECDLPVELPEMDDFLPEGKGKGPLAKNKDFVNTKCPTCGGKATRETDVSDPFVDSAWYFLRYPSTEFDNVAIDKSRSKKWLPVDSYIGGKEHTVLHLLYSRFITMVLNDLGYIDFEEPYKRFFGHGLITKDGAKMSKSKGNVINPDEMLEKYGADAVRLYLRFLGDFSQGGDWRDDGAEGMARFVKKLWQTFFELEGKGKGVKKTQKINQTIKVIGEDIEKLSFNTAVARYMEFVNWIRENSNDFNKEQAQKIKETLALTIAPMAPFIAEEFWASLGNKKSIFLEKWPEFNKDNLEDDQFELVIQVNGKVRDRIEVPRGIEEKEAEKKALASEKIIKHLDGQKPKKIIYIKEKLVNIVV